MKIINLTVGRNPPLIRANSKSYKAVCYKLIETKCDVDESPSITTVSGLRAVIPNKTRANYPYTISSSSESGIRYRIYDEGTFIKTGLVSYSENKFKVILPPLSEGYYYLEVYGLGGYNKVMINVT